MLKNSQKPIEANLCITKKLKQSKLINAILKY